MKKDSISVKTRRFIYHVSYKSKRASIDKQGILCFSNDVLNYKNAVFANNAPPSFDWFPICLDSWDWMGTYLDYDEEVSKYDVWRIDTHKCSNKWYLDDRVDGGQTSTYVVSFEKIDRVAIELYKIGMPKTVFTINDGVAHYHSLGGMNENKLQKISIYK